jgi:hypothetical protein
MNRLPPQGIISPAIEVRDTDPSSPYNGQIWLLKNRAPAFSVQPVLYSKTETSCVIQYTATDAESDTIVHKLKQDSGSFIEVTPTDVGGGVYRVTVSGLSVGDYTFYINVSDALNETGTASNVLSVSITAPVVILEQTSNTSSINCSTTTYAAEKFIAPSSFDLYDIELYITRLSSSATVTVELYSATSFSATSPDTLLGSVNIETTDSASGVLTWVKKALSSPIAMTKDSVYWLIFKPTVSNTELRLGSAATLSNAEMMKSTDGGTTYVVQNADLCMRLYGLGA